ncbi:MAG: protein kinase [Blastocatellia bacterium]|nr:protein kinase [Blastocatellia bacterium]
MNTCKECGSEVAEEDVFCPFCGLALPPPITQEPAEDPLESTIMMPAEDAAALAAAASRPSPTENQDLAANDETEDAPGEEAVEPEPPLPEFLGGPKSTSDNIFAKPTSGSVQIDSEEAELDTVSIEELPAEAEMAHIDEDPAEDPAEAPATETPATSMSSSFTEDATMIGIPLEQLSQSDDWDDEASESVQSSATTAEPPEEESIASDGGDFIPESIVDDSEPEIDAEKLNAADPAGESGISKPLEDLADHEPFSNPMFDSVRIIENSHPPRPDDVATSIRPLSAEDAKGGREPEAAPSGGFEAPREATSPNIGEADTGSRRSAKLKPLAEGTILNQRYEIVRKIGGGGMGAVYLASDNNLGGVLRAVKEMVQTHIEDDQQEKAINDFKRESMILSTLDHPSIPTIYDYFFDEEESRFYLVMKYISGGDLSSRLRATSEGKIDEKMVTEWAIEIVDVLDYLHSQPSTIVYRDLKPSNIMVDGNSGRVMLIDFGIARSISQREEKGVTAVGTMGYAPPELFSGNVEPRSDIYSLGSTMFHLLTGADPQSNPLLIFDFQKNPRPRQINPRLSDQMERILMRAVEYSAEARFSSAAEMRAALESHLESLRGGQVSYGVSAAPEAVSLANQNVFCGFCGQRIVATDLFCAFCGSKQPIAQHGVQSGIYTKAVPTAKLVIEGTSDLAPSGFSLQKDENLVGRRDPMSNIFPEVDLSKFDPQTKISRRHARIWRDGSNFLVEDLGSSNGTILDTNINSAIRLTPHQPHPLTSGDKIRIGDTTLQFVVS